MNHQEETLKEIRTIKWLVFVIALIMAGSLLLGGLTADDVQQVIPKE